MATEVPAGLAVRVESAEAWSEEHGANKAGQAAHKMHTHAPCKVDHANA